MNVWPFPQEPVRYGCECGAKTGVDNSWITIPADPHAPDCATLKKTTAARNLLKAWRPLWTYSRYGKNSLSIRIHRDAQVIAQSLHNPL